MHFSAGKTFWTNYNKDLLKYKIYTDVRQYGTAKNVIFFLGDGMSITTLTAARIYMGQTQNRSGESESLSFEKFPNIGLSKVSCNAQVTHRFTICLSLIEYLGNHVHGRNSQT